MEPLFCPNATVWGTVADYLNVAIAMVVGAGVFALGRSTNRLTEAANRTNEQAGKIAADDIRRDADNDRREGDLLLLYTLAEIQVIGRDLLALRGIVAGQTFIARYNQDADMRNKVSAFLKLIPTTAMSTRIDRVHLLSDRTAGKFLQLISGLAILRDLTSNAAVDNHYGLTVPKVGAFLQGSVPQLLENVEYLRTECEEIITRLGITLAARPADSHQA